MNDDPICDVKLPAPISFSQARWAMSVVQMFGDANNGTDYTVTADFDNVALLFRAFPARSDEARDTRTTVEMGVTVWLRYGDIMGSSMQEGRVDVEDMLAMGAKLFNTAAYGASDELRRKVDVYRIAADLSTDGANE